MKEGQSDFQKKQYWIPYHYIPRFTKQGFTHVYNFYWAFEYMALMNFVRDNISDDVKKHLDFGCGDGRLLNYLYAGVDSSIQAIGVDKDERAISLAKMLNEDNEIEYVCDDVYNIDEKFDIISCVEVLEHIEPCHVQNIVDCLYDRLSENGRLIVTVPSANIPLNKKHYLHCSREGFRKLFDKFSNVQIGYLVSNDFLHRMILKLMSNRIFILNNERLIEKLLNIFLKNVAPSSEDKCMHLTAICSK